MMSYKIRPMTSADYKAAYALEQLGITKVALVVFDRNKDGNSFWEKQGFTVRDDPVYRNRSLAETKRFDT